MSVISLSPFDLSVAASMVILLAIVSFLAKIGVARQLVIAGIRTTIQLLLLGLVLKAVFDTTHPGWISLICLMMLIVAGREVMNRQKRRFSGWWGFGVGSLSMFISSFSITIIILTVIIANKPWYDPQYAIPLLGMLLGNTMNGIAIGLDRLTQMAWDQRKIIEGRLMLGQEWKEAIGHIREDSIRSGLIPIINSMAVAGIVSIPGMMTGQILAGSPPWEAAKYQILIMFAIAAGAGFGSITAVRLGSKRLFDHRQRLRLDRLKNLR